MTETESTTATTATTTKSGANGEPSSEPTALLNAEDWARKSRETKQAKAVRLLTTGRLRVFHVEPHIIEAECRGDSGELYRLGWRNGLWNCSCQARTDCSHLAALWCVTAVARVAP